MVDVLKSFRFLNQYFKINLYSVFGAKLKILILFIFSSTDVMLSLYKQKIEKFRLIHEIY